MSETSDNKPHATSNPNAHRTQRLPASLSAQAQGFRSPIGRVLKDRYVITRLLGRGATGEVYAARPLLGRHEEYAIKVVELDRFDYHDEREATHRIVTEVRAMLALRSAHVIHFHDWFELPGGKVAIVTELIKGIPLDALIQAEGGLGVVRSCELARQIAVGLHDAHRAGIVHRDLKPSNVLIEQDSTRRDFARIIDFGISLRADQTRITQGFLGTPAFASPEQFLQDAGLDHRSDIYSLGVVLYTMIVGDVPFDSPSVMQLVRRHIQEPLPRLTETRPDLHIPSTLQELLDHATEKRPEDRFPNMLGLVWELEALLEQLDPARHAHDLSERPSWHRKRCARCGHLNSCLLTDGALRPCAISEHDDPTIPDLAPLVERLRTHWPDQTIAEETEAAPTPTPHTPIRMHHDLAAVERAGQLWCARGPARPEAKLEEAWPLSDTIAAFDVRPDHLAIGTTSGIVQRVDRATGRAETLMRLDAAPTAIALSRDGAELIAAAGVNLHIWRAPADQGHRPQQRTIHLDAPVTSINLESAALPFLVARTDRVAELFMPLDHGELRTQRFDLAAPARDITMSHDGYIVALLLDDGRVVVHEALSGTLLRTYTPRNQTQWYAITFDERGALIGATFQDDRIIYHEFL